MLDFDHCVYPTTQGISIYQGLTNLYLIDYSSYKDQELPLMIIPSSISIP